MYSRVIENERSDSEPKCKMPKYLTLTFVLAGIWIFLKILMRDWKCSLANLLFSSMPRK